MRRAAGAALVLAALAGRPALGQSPPDRLDPAAAAALQAAYLTDEERKDLRVFHGVWTREDLDTPARRAAAALVLGRYGHEALSDPGAPAEDRAEAALRRGEPERALEVLAGAGSVRAARVRAEALMDLGRHAEAAGAVEPVIERLSARRLESSGELAEAVRALTVRSRAVGSELGDGGDFRQMMALLGRARDELGRLDWRVRLAEAELLYDRHNRPEAQAAALETLALNPRCAAALALLGRLATDAFDFGRLASVADALDALALDEGPLEGGQEGGSAEARLVEARAWLRQRNAEEAMAAVERVLGVWPTHRTGLALRAAALAVGAREAETAEALAAFQGLSPGSPAAELAVGRALAEARQYDLAPAHLERAAAMLPGDSTAPMELGLIQLQAGRDGLAIEHLARAVALDPFNARANNSLTLARELAAFERVETEHFVVRHKPGIDAVLAADMPAVLERLHARVTGDAPGGIDHTPGARTLIDLMPDHERFAVRITGMPDLWTIAASTGPVIAMEPPRDGPGKKTGPYDWARVLQHEYTHTVTLSRSANRIPHWMTEGMSVVLEDRPRDPGTWRELAGMVREQRLFDLRELNIAFVRPREQGDRGRAYAQSAWLIEFINARHGPEAPRRILDELGRGASDAEAFERVLGVPVDELLAAFEAWAREDLVRWGVEAPEGVPGVVDLIERDLGTEGAPEIGDVAMWVDEHPEQPELWDLWIAMALQERGGVPDMSMAPMLERAAGAMPADDRPARLLARVYLSSQDPAVRAKAIPHLEHLDLREQNSPAYASELARLHAAAGDTEAAWRSSERAAMIAPYDADEREFAARVAIQAGQLGDARRHIAALVLLEPDRERHRQRLEAIDRMLAGG